MTKKIDEKILSQSDIETQLIIQEDVYKKVMHWVDKADTEVSGLGSVVIRNGVAYVVDAILLKQEVSKTETELDAAAIAEAMYEHDSKNKIGELRWWWHSHVNMGVFWSGTDITTIEQLGREGWFISTVFNKKRESQTAYYSGSPFRVFLDNIETLILNELPKRLVDQWDKEFETRVTEAKPVVTYLPHYTKKTELCLFLYGLDEPLKEQVYDLRKAGWKDEHIATQLHIEDNLIESEYFGNGFMQQEMEELRRSGFTEQDIEAMEGR